jgi:hypothetical protein
MSAQFGWTCGICGVWVGDGETHVCQGRNWTTNEPFPKPTEFQQLMAKLDEIATLLRRRTP